MTVQDFLNFWNTTQTPREYEYKIFEWSTPDKANQNTNNLEIFLNGLARDGWIVFQVHWPFPSAWKCYVYTRRETRA